MLSNIQSQIILIQLSVQIFLVTITNSTIRYNIWPVLHYYTHILSYITHICNQYYSIITITIYTHAFHTICTYIIQSIYIIYICPWMPSLQSCKRPRYVIGTSHMSGFAHPYSHFIYIYIFIICIHIFHICWVLDFCRPFILPICSFRRQWFLLTLHLSHMIYIFILQLKYIFHISPFL